MVIVTLEQCYGTFVASCRVSDNMFDENVPPVFGYGRDPDTAISRLLSDYPEIVDYRLISRHEYEVLWDQHDDSMER